ncbi:methionine--tRNA ligase [Burkholderia singularis]|uniref:Methionyl-tRNA synthetase-related protein n=1 Tax=Burkholderia singularis TaxID=1503053 RepID=A0A238HA87_9BURK|nr:methionine--tRNA ligase [Burkholderia singularis]SMG02244.1 Methionyl-tRNA synthetase-related protein [Burkholderia singularis]
MTKFVVTITPPTPNGDLHIGHLAGPFLAADVFARAQRQRGHECVLISYSDDYQSYMLRKGRELATDPVALARANTEKINATLAAADVQIDHWHQPYENAYFAEAVRRVYRAAQDKQAFDIRISDEPYCPSCNVWGYEAFGRGNCNYCGADSDASQCEGCAQEPDSKQMANFRCKLCGGRHTWRPVERVFLRLPKFQSLLRSTFRQMPLRRPMGDWIADTIDTKLHDWGVTRPEDGGLDLAADGSRRVHTWFMGLAGYMAAFREYAEVRQHDPGLFERYWHSDDSRLVHFLGFDCAFSHAIVYPTLLANMPELRIRQHFYPNQFLTLDGLNLSTSRNHAIWMRDLVAESCSDSARLYLASISPEEGEGDFSRQGFRDWRQSVFTEFLETLPLPFERATEPWTPSAPQDVALLIAGFRQRWLSATSSERFSMRQLAHVVLDLIAVARERHAAQRLDIDLIVAIAAFGKPLMPKFAARVFDAYGVGERDATAYLVNGTAAEYSI